MKDIKHCIRKDASTVLFMVVFFIVYYFFLIAIGLALFGGALWVTCQIPNILSEVHSFNLRAVILAILAFAAMWWFCIQIGWFLIKPLFLVHKSSRDGLLEIKANECPELFDTIKEVANATGNKMPKHVFLSSETNAYVFYNSTSLWSIFFPSRKNMTIGIGLLRGLSNVEVKAIISHEFGHFSQKSMRVGTVTHRLLLTVREMVSYAQERQESNAVARASEEYKWYFHMEIYPISLITKSVIAFYNLIDKKDKRLSRNMEFEADATACSIVGSNSMISSLCKLDTISERYASYENAIYYLLQNGSYPSDFWKGYLLYNELVSEKDAFNITYLDEFSTPATAEEKPSSQLSFSNEYCTHPSLEERIISAKACNFSINHTSKKDASLLIPNDCLNGIGLVRMKYLVKQLGEQNGDKTISLDKLHVMRMEQFKQWLDLYYHENCSPRYISPFVNREVVNFAKPQIDEKEKIFSPFTDEYRKMLLFYLQGIKDWNTLIEIRNNGNNLCFVYNKQNYNDAGVALKTHQEYLDSFMPHIQNLDINIYKYLWHRTNDKKRIESIYWMMLYGAKCMHELHDLKQFVNQIDGQIAFYRQHGESVSIKDEIVEQIENDFKTFLNSFDFDNIDSMIGQWVDSNNISVHDHLKELRQYQDGSIRFSGVMLVNRLINDTWFFLEELYNVSKSEWRQRVIAAYLGEEFIISSNEKSRMVDYQNDKVEDELEGTETVNEEMNVGEMTNSRCLHCIYYTEKILNTESPITVGIDTLAPGIGVQNVVSWCRLNDTPIEDDMTECQAFCKKESITENNDVPKYELLIEYPTSTDTVDLDKDVIKELVLEARERLYKDGVDPDIIVEDFMQRELTEEEAKIIVNKAIRT